MTDEKKPMKECINCGLCLANCPSYKATLNEKCSPRGRVRMVLNESPDETFYVCTLCKACEESCPLKLELDFRKEREKLEKTKRNEEMIEKVRKYGNPFGEVAEGEVPEDLYCC